MRITTILASASLATATLAAPASAALLSNPGFESAVNSSPDASANDVPMSTSGPWAGWNNWVAPYSAFYTSAVARTGTQAGKTYSGPNAGVYQFANVTAGQEYTASAWFLNRAADPMQGAQTADIRIIFKDGPNGTGGDVGVFVAPTAVSAATTPDVWAPLAVTAVAPPGAVSAQVMAFFNNPGGAGGAMHVDDMDLVAIPEPAGLAAAALGALSLLSRRRRRA